MNAEIWRWVGEKQRTGAVSDRSGLHAGGGAMTARIK